MDKLERLAILKTDRDEILSELCHKREVREECATPAMDIYLLNRIRRLELEYAHVCKNIYNVERGFLEEPWIEPISLGEANPDEGASLWQ